VFGENHGCGSQLNTDLFLAKIILVMFSILRMKKHLLISYLICIPFVSLIARVEKSWFTVYLKKSGVHNWKRVCW